MPAAIRMIAIDIDGTLLAPASTVVSSRNAQALRQAEAAGLAVVIATGRRHAYSMPQLQPVGLLPETVLITSNGTVTRTQGGRTLDRRLLPLDTARALCPALRPFGRTTIFTFDREGPGSLAVESLEKLEVRIPAWVAANRSWITEVHPLESAFDHGEAPLQAMVCGTVSSMEDAAEQLLASELAPQFEVHRTVYPLRDLTALDILPPGCSKGSALRRLAAQRGVAHEEILAIGDNWNDLGMLEIAGRPVVMANGTPSLLDLARQRQWQIAPPNDQDGVAQVIEELLSSGQPGAETAAGGRTG